MGFKLIKTEVLQLQTREQVIAKAEELNKIGGTTGEREEKERHEAKIKEKILLGEMVPFIWAIGRVPSENDLKQRVDGQHSGQVFLKLTDEDWANVTFPVTIIYQEYECDTHVDLAVLFEQFNPPWSSRSREDLIGAHLAYHPDLQTVNRYSANHATAGILWYLQQVEGYRGQSAADQFQLIHKNSEIHRFIRFCGEGELNLTRGIAQMGQKPVVAVMFHTTRFGSDHDRAFWRQVSGGTHANVDEATLEYKIAYFLERAHACTGEWPGPLRRAFHNKKDPNAVEIFGICLRAFVAYKKNLRIGEIVTPLTQRTPRDIVQSLMPLPSKQAA